MRNTLLLILLLASLCISGQTVISGTINSYDTLASQSSGPCADELQTNGSQIYQAGDLLLIICTHGASYDNSNSNTFGDVVNLNSAGLYELAFVTAYNSGKITLDRSLQNTYPSGTQLVKVPQYASAEVRNGNLTGKKFDRYTGGIIALKANKLELFNSISAEGIGFGGGFSAKNMGYSCGSAALYYPAGNNGGAPKGKGLAAIQQSQMNGRGAVTIGGGGGNNHNAGGGGGANAGAGGQGGDEWSGCSPSASVGGLGGKALSTVSTSRVFMGGGGGSGHNNLSNFSSEGGDGGGIIILLADTIITNNFAITASGTAGKSITNSGAEGAGGGAGGGSILVSTRYITGTLGLFAEGGDGGDVTSGTAGPGGGGGGGFIAVPAASQLNSGASIISSVSGGAAGTLSAPSNNYGATAGSSGLQNNALALNTQPQNVPDSSFFPSDTSLCSDNLILSGPANSGPYLWSNGSTDSSIVVSNSGSYWLRVGNFGCSSSDTIVVNLTSPVQFSLGADTTLCPGDSLILQAPTDPSYTLRWDDGSSNSSRTVYPGGSYWLEVRNDSCVSRDTISVDLLNISRSNLFNAADITICENESLAVDLTNLPGAVLWQDGETQKLRTLRDSGLYWVEWTSPCFEIRDSLYLQTENCEDCLMTVPNAFTPNGDGLNDRFKILFGCELQFFQMDVMNRWGATIYSSTLTKPYWDGTVNGMKAPEGVYIFKITYRTKGRIDTKFEQGIITLIR